MAGGNGTQRPVVKPTTVDKLWTPANIVTLVRICLVPVFVVALISPWPIYFGLEDSYEFKRWLAAAIFIVLAATDGLDGYLARSRGEVTDFGKFMDPLADKILVAAALLSLIELGALPSWPALVILIREFIVSGIRMVAASKGTVIAASWYGKAKTVTQIIAIVLFIIKDNVAVYTFHDAISNPLYIVSWAFMIVAVILTIVSMLDYFVKARHILGFTSPKEKDSDSAKDKDSNVAYVSECTYSELATCGTSELAAKCIQIASEKGLSIGTAESLTGGLIDSALTSVPGSSAVVRGGIVSYAEEVKRDILDVPSDVLSENGVVSRETACAMAEGAIEKLDCQLSVAVTGIAGPGGAEPGKPVGTVWMATCFKGESPEAYLWTFEGDREQVRESTVRQALVKLVERIESR